MVSDLVFRKIPFFFLSLAIAVVAGFAVREGLLALGGENNNAGLIGGIVFISVWVTLLLRALRAKKDTSP
ncbi:MAG: hypothetical protein AB7M05_07115 [Alphaproteobacteria bacterium]